MNKYDIFTKDKGNTVLAVKDGGEVKVFTPKLEVYPFIIHFAIVSIVILYAFLMRSYGFRFNILSYLIVFPLGLFILFLIMIYPTMRYEFRQDALYLIYGPVKRKIDYKDIVSVIKANLKYDFSSTGWKLPGYALFSIYYVDRGYVWMCATRLLNDILLITTAQNKLFGVTPQDEKGFISELEKRTQK
ncbi:MAG: hypothetical protein KBG49_07495 [Spirochaetes bacterium]|nr:hypothetical protein [Spirochaetota bacterium]